MFKQIRPGPKAQNNAAAFGLHAQRPAAADATIAQGSLYFSYRSLSPRLSLELDSMATIAKAPGEATYHADSDYDSGCVVPAGLRDSGGVQITGGSYPATLQINSIFGRVMALAMCVQFHVNR
jgi:hypothetical protein